MYDNPVWNLVDHTPLLKTIRCTWVSKKKTSMDENVHTFKAQLVAKGYTQNQVIDYKETLSPVEMIKSIRILFAITTFHNCEIWKIDVRTTFLTIELTEDVYIAQPKGYV